MDWKRTAFDWNRARAFLATAEEGSFSAAARALGLAQPTLGRQVAALEEELGVVLFERIGYRLQLTPTGAELAEQIRSMNEAAVRVSRIAAGQSQGLGGVVRVAASEATSAFILPPLVGQLRLSHPGIEVELVVSNAVSDLRGRQADIAIRHTQPEGDDFFAKRIRSASTAHLYGTPAYLDSLGNPATQQDLARVAEVIGFDESDRFRAGLAAVGYPFGDGQLPVRTDNQLVQWNLARAGIGLCMMVAEIGDTEPLVRRALPDVGPAFTFGTWLVSHRDLKMNRRMRVVFDALSDYLDGYLRPD